MNIFSYVCISILFADVTAFIPHPAIRLGSQAGESITHTEMVQLGFTRSLARFFLDTGTQNKKSTDADNLKSSHTIDELYQLAHPDWTSEQVQLYSYPLKSIIDRIQVRDALVDLNPLTKNLPSAHFDSESFVESNRRIMDLRKKVIEDASNPNKDLDQARGRIGDLLHTLQDFYSHSNWIEMGQTNINDRIGLQEGIGQIAGIMQDTCSDNGCTKIQAECNLLQKFILKTCPLEYYDCKNNILNDINTQGLLTSGYVSDQFNADNQPVIKPTNVAKCSHGSIMDKTAHQPPIGGINKDTMTPMYSPHYHLHFEAVKLAVEATERFFNDLRKDLGDQNFDRLFAINPMEEQIQAASVAIADKQQFHFLTSTLSVGLSSGDLNFQKTAKQRIEKILSILFGVKNWNTPTYDLSDNGVDKSDVNIHSSSLLFDSSKTIKRRRLGRYRY